MDELRTVDTRLSVVNHNVLERGVESHRLNEGIHEAPIAEVSETNMGGSRIQTCDVCR
jgi:hypothetical protein